MAASDDRPETKDSRGESDRAMVDEASASAAATLEDLKQASLDLKKRIEEKRPPHREPETPLSDELRSAEVLGNPENLNNQ